MSVPPEKAARSSTRGSIGRGSDLPASKSTKRSLKTDTVGYGAVGGEDNRASTPAAHGEPETSPEDSITPAVIKQLPYLCPVTADPDADHDILGPVMSQLETAGLFRSDSMEMSNDPRFFQGSILSKRLAAFSALSVVSGLMVGFCQGKVLDVHCTNLTSLGGVLHFTGFIISCGALFANIIATYVSVAQTYHVSRLESAGPTGFEMASSYYLNPNVVAWRHLAIKFMLLSLPMLLISTGISIEEAFTDAVSKPEPANEFTARILAIGSLVMFVCMAGVLYYVHSIHAWVFMDRYDMAMENHAPYMQRVQSILAQRRNTSGALDV